MKKLTAAIIAATMFAANTVHAQKAFWSTDADATSPGMGFVIQGKHLPDNVGVMVDKAWQEAQECTGVYVDPQHLVIINYTKKLKKRNNEGTIYLTKSMVYIEANKRDLRGHKKMSTTKHEFVHYLRWLGGATIRDAFKKHPRRIYKKCETGIKM